MADKYRYAECILYPENMIDSWQKDIDDLIQLPFAYCIHDKDKDCRVHVHLILVHNNTVALSFFQKWVNNRLSKEGFKCCSTVQPIINPKQAFNYLIHDTDKARSEGKVQYKQSERITGNDFDIHHFIQIDENTKLMIVQEITDRILNHQVMDLVTLYPWIESKGQDFFSVFVSRSSYFDRLCSGMWKKWERSKKNEDK